MRFASSLHRALCFLRRSEVCVSLPIRLRLFSSAVTMADEEENSRCISLTTFNVLAPCYHNSYLPSQSFTSRSRSSTSESDSMPAVRARLRSLLSQMLHIPMDRNEPLEGERDQSTDDLRTNQRVSSAAIGGADGPGSVSDVLCLQEYWLDNDEYTAMFREALADTHDVFVAARCDWKRDGLATFVRRGLGTVVQTRELRFKDTGSRVVLLLLLKLHSGGRVVVVNTHLTFPHHQFDVNMRGMQARTLVGWVERFCREVHCSTVIMAGDFNGPQGDNVYQCISDAGFRSCYLHANGREAGVTHIAHTGAEVGCDFVWLKQREMDAAEGNDSASLSVIRAVVEPRHLSDRKWPRAAMASDHRPVTVTFRMENR